MLLSSLGEKKTNEAFGEKNKRINCLILNRSISTRCGVQRGSQKERKEKKRKETFTEPSLFTFGEEVAWGPRGASRLQFDGAVRGGAEAYSWKGDVEPCRVYCPGGSPTPDASTWNECIPQPVKILQQK